MPKVAYNGNEYTCVTALKGENYIRLLDGAGCKVASFEGVRDFTLFTISDGDWTTEQPEKNSRIARVLSDGSVVPSEFRCAEIVRKSASVITFDTSTEKVMTGQDGVKYYVYSVPLPETAQAEYVAKWQAGKSVQWEPRTGSPGGDAAYFLKNSVAITVFNNKHYVASLLNVNTSEGTCTFEIVYDASIKGCTDLINGTIAIIPAVEYEMTRGLN